MKTSHALTALTVVALMLATVPLGTGVEGQTGQPGGEGRTAPELQTQPPAYGPPPQGDIYGGPYPPPPYPYSPYPWPPPPQGLYAPRPADPFGGQLIPAGRLFLLVDPVAAEVFVDGLLRHHRH